MMKILFYHKHLQPPEQDILERAAQRKHMLKKTIWWDIALFFVTGIGGTLLFLFSPMLMRIPMMGAIVPIKNSIWENLKLFFVPAVLIGLIRWLCTGNLQKGIVTTYMQSLLLTMGIFITGHYLCTGIAGQEYFRADMLLYYSCVILLVWDIRVHADRQKKSSLPGFVILILMAVCFIYFTYHMPPDIGLFRDIILLQQ